MMTFHAMGTNVTVGAPSLTEEAEEALSVRIASLFEEREQRFSRFRTDSELSRLLAHAGPSVVSEEMFETLWSAQRHLEATAGLFDPAIGATLVALGYDRSIDEGPLDRETPTALPPQATFREVVLDPWTRTVERPAHVSIDLGGIVKGRTVDEAARLLPAVGVVEAGGDAYLRGAGPDGRGWPVEVEDPRDPERTLVTLRVTDRAVATSAPNRRRWRVPGGLAHHLIDPRTQAPALADLAQVTVVAASTELAEVLAKTLFLLGLEAARELLAALPEVGAVLVRLDGTPELVGALALDAPDALEVPHA